MQRLVVLIVLVASMAACSGRPADDDAKAAATAPSAVRQKTVLDDQLKALDKAKAVQQTVDDAAKTQRDAIDAAERPAPPADDDKGG